MCRWIRGTREIGCVFMLEDAGALRRVLLTQKRGAEGTRLPELTGPMLGGRYQRHRTREAEPERRAGARGSAEPGRSKSGLCDLYVGIDGHAQGS